MKTALSCLILAAASICAAQPAPAHFAPSEKSAATTTRIVPGSKVFIEPMDGFETYLSAAILKKKVPLVVVDDKANADYILSGGSKVDKASWAKTVFISPLPHATASVQMKDAHSGALVFAYAVDKSNARRADQSTAEACAKHLKNAIDAK